VSYAKNSLDGAEAAPDTVPSSEWESVLAREFDVRYALK
jgi:hypothetical protein